MTGNLTRIVEPGGPMLDDARVWDHLRVDLVSGSPEEPEDAALIRVYRDAVTAHLDGPDGILGRALISQGWELRLAAFPQRIDRIYGDRRIELPLPPLQSVTKIKYVDPDGATQTLADELYTVLTDNGSEPGAVIPAYGTTWPATRCQPDAVTVTFVAGYGGTPADVPAAISAASLLLIEDLYANRSAKEVGTIVTENPAVMRLLRPHIRVGFA